RPIIAISGNHDSSQFVEAPDPLAREMGIFFYSRYDSLIPSGTLDSGVKILRTDRGFMELKLPKINFPIRLILAPYAHEVSLRTYLGEENREEEFRNLLANKWKNLADQYCDTNGVNAFVGHFFFAKNGAPLEAEPESERPILHVGGTQALFTENLPAQIQYAALGHLHRYHAVDKNPCPVVYSSSPLAYSFSEADQEKQVVIVSLEPGKAAEYKPIPLKSGRPLYRKTFDKLPDTLDWLEKYPYCFVELTFQTEHSIDAATRKAINQAHDGIVNLIPQIKNPQEQASLSLKAEDLEKDMLSLFKLYFQRERGQEPNEELLEIFKEVISQDSNA
ncbi:MAG: exonuclease sbcCD subunit D, partial [Cyclobacteriaceae bacterium]|nr:exonuclease sbcCD subunit D [Cyclobacteriaceae bacterium]